MKQIALIILVCVSSVFISCADEAIDNNTVEISSKVNVNEKKLQTEPNLTPTPNEKSSTESIEKCQPKSNLAKATASQDTEINQTLPKPDSREAFNEWLKDLFGAVQVATLPNRKFINEYFWEGDLNGDGCEDVAIIVQGVKNNSGNISMESSAIGTSVQDLRSKIIFNGADKENVPSSKDLAVKIKPKEDIAIAIVFGGRNGWNRKQNAAGRKFLLYDSIFKPDKAANYEIGSTLFFIIRKDKPQEDDDDLLYLFPRNAVGDCIYTATQTKRKKVVFSEMTNRYLICFDGNAFFDKKLPDSKSYPE